MVARGRLVQFTSVVSCTANTTGDGVEAAVGGLNMTVYDVLGFDSLVGKEAIGGLEHGAVATGFGPRGPGILGQNGGEFYKALGASQVAEFRLGKFVDGPGGVIGQTGAYAVPVF